MEAFNEYVNKDVAPLKGLPKDWVLNEFTVTFFFKVKFRLNFSLKVSNCFKIEKNASDNAASNS